MEAEKISGRRLPGLYFNIKSLSCRAGAGEGACLGAQHFFSVAPPEMVRAALDAKTHSALAGGRIWAGRKALALVDLLSQRCKAVDEGLSAHLHSPSRPAPSLEGGLKKDRKIEA